MGGRRLRTGYVGEGPGFSEGSCEDYCANDGGDDSAI